MQIHATATQGGRCRHERHEFRIGIAADQATSFSATEDEFPGAVTDAMIDHGLARRPGWDAPSMHLQVRTGRTSWHNCQNPETGHVVGITPQIAGQPETMHALFGWCCNAVQMVRDLQSLTSGLADASVEEGQP